MGAGEADGDEVAIDLVRPATAPAQVRAAAKARLLAASLGASSQSPERELVAGRYRLVREIGRGGIGSVWEAELAPIGKRVAIKLLRRDAVARSGDHAARLLREAQAASAIGHEHIVRVDDFGVDPDAGPFLVMELLRGRSLALEIVAHAPMPWPRVAGLLLQLCSALAAAHRVGIVHRDLKPANVFLTEREGGADHCKLLDFGLCKPMPEAELAGVLTTLGTRLGTPGYMAPEQIRGDEVDGRADLYALGCVAHEMLSGKPPFEARRIAELIEAHVQAEPPSLDVRVPGTPRDVAELVLRLLAKSPEQRFADADALARAIRATGIDARAAEHTVPAPGRASTTVASPPTTSRWRLAAGVSIAAFAGGAMAVIATFEPPRLAERALPLQPLVVRAAAAAPTRPPAPRAPTSTAAPAPSIPAVVALPTPEPRPLPRARRRAPAPVPPVERTPPPPPDPPKASLVDGIRDPFGGK